MDPQATPCHRYGIISNNDVEAMCSLMSKIKSVLVFEDTTDYDATMKAMPGGGGIGGPRLP